MNSTNNININKIQKKKKDCQQQTDFHATIHNCEYMRVVCSEIEHATISDDSDKE